MEPFELVAAKLNASVIHAARLLPPQGPLGKFAFLNPLQGLQDRPFIEGLEEGARLFGCMPYLPKDFYRDHLASGRIVLDDLMAVLKGDLGESAEARVKPSGTRFEMRLAMLVHPLRSAPTQELRWFIAETDALNRFGSDVPETLRQKIVSETKHWVFHDVLTSTSPEVENGASPAERSTRQFVADLINAFGRSTIEVWDDRKWETFSLQTLWHVCWTGLESVDVPVSEGRIIRHRGRLVDLGYDDPDLLVEPVLIRFCSLFTDQGISTWELPGKDKGFFRSFTALFQVLGLLNPRWMKSLPVELKRIESMQVTPLQLIHECLLDLGVNEEDWDEYLQSTILALPGWAGIIWQLESRPDRVPRPVPEGSLVEFVAIRLLLDRLALRFILSRQMAGSPVLLGVGCDELSPERSSIPAASIEQRTFYLFQLAQVMGWSATELMRLTGQEWSELAGEIDAFPSLARRRVFHLAYEHRLKIKSLDALSHNNRRPAHPPVKSQMQAVFCLDAREESIRRHLEEQSPTFETYGTAGFFGVAMYFRGISDAHFAAQCPANIRPKHWVIEEAAPDFQASHRSRARSRRLWGLAVHRVHIGSRSFGPGAILSASLGSLASIPLVMRVLFPALTARIRHAFGEFVAAPSGTRLQFERTELQSQANSREIGFTVDEMADIGGRALQDIGLTSNFARLVFFIGHGSGCQNNPHESTYHCGACTGKPGGQNSRVLASILNHQQVRTILATRNIVIPEETVFVGGSHNTCDDLIEFYDRDQLPKSHIDGFMEAKQAFDEACLRNSHERCRRFYSAPLTITPEDAHRHVKNRSEDLAQTRPEYGNASNAICVVGRRERTKGLFLDRRSFLQSYDPTQDDQDFTILARILSAVVPVCSGINMMYTLSAIDGQGWGCGTKLPHNITSLLGVMDGASSDLRCGLPVQGVEIHEPVRLLFVLETTPEGILKVMAENPAIRRVFANGWAQCAVLDPNSDRLQVYEGGRFRCYEPTTVDSGRGSSSLEWYRGSREHLDFALIG